MEAKVQELDRKLQTLKFTRGKSNEVIEMGNINQRENRGESHIER